MAAVDVRVGLSLIVCFVWSIWDTNAQFPAVCVENATLPDSTCCPTPLGFTEPCGGPARGRCVRVQHTEDLSQVPEASQRDDRIDWPTKFFKNVCSCYGNFSGYMCHECWYGNKGPNCSESFQLVRKEVSRFTTEERERFISVLIKSMEVKSDFMILNTSHSSDPTTKPQFLNATVFHFWSYVHYYASRQTNFGNDSLCDDGNNMVLDFAHSGPMFPIWHRVYILKWEQALRKLSGDENFALPYWDWIDAGKTCKVCTDEWFGSRNQSDPTGTISRNSVFSKARIMCFHKTGCQVCDPSVQDRPIVRRLGENPIYPNLETRKAVDFTMTLTTFDLHPFSIRSPNTAFRNVFEGFANADGPSIIQNSMHNLVHRFFNGTMTDLPTAAMDPVFFVHHSFLDKLFEIWRRKNKVSALGLPVIGAQPGHNRNSYIVPFFPPEQAFSFFQDTENLGYKYDNLNIDDSMPQDDGTDSHFLASSWIVVFQGIVIMVLVISMIILVRNRKREISELSDKDPIINAKTFTSMESVNKKTYQSTS